MIVSKRYQGEKHYITEFVQPGNAGVVELANQITRASGDFALNCLNWVRSNVEYPRSNDMEYIDWHYFEAFRVVDNSGNSQVLEKRWASEFWQFPAETISLKVGDCDDGAILLCSLLRTRIPANEVFVTVGKYAGKGHAWVTCNGLVFETSTFENLPSEQGGIYQETYPYAPTLRFNDQIVL